MIGITNDYLKKLLDDYKEERVDEEFSFEELASFILARSNIIFRFRAPEGKDVARNGATGTAETSPKGLFTQKATVLKESAWATAVIDVRQGRKKNGVRINSGRSIASKALGPAQTGGAQNDRRTGEIDSFSLGFGGTLTLYFENAIINGPGKDGRVYEITRSDGTYPEEKVKIEISADGVSWSVAVPAGTRDTSFDLGQLNCAAFVRLTDVTKRELHEQDSDAFDVDAVKAENAQRGPCRR